MPDQSEASTEHAIIQEIAAPLATLPDDPVPEVADVEFPTALRGYDRLAVDAYVQKTAQLVAELQATRSPDAAVRRALERVGEEVSGILQRAHEAGAQITAQSRSDAEDRLEAARREAAQIVSTAEERVRELDAETDRIWAERHRIVEDTRDLARELLSVTDSAAGRFPAEAVALGEAAGAGAEVVPPVDDDAPEHDIVLEDDEIEFEEEVEPEDIFADEQDQDVEPTRVLPVVEHAEPSPEDEDADGPSPEDEDEAGHQTGPR
jgi:DivIVA domain-containing protein